MKIKLKKLKVQRYWIPVGISLAMIAVFFIFQNGTCNQAASDNTKLGSNSNTNNNDNGGPAGLNIFVSSSSVAVGSTIQFSATGGTQPYTFYALSGAGTINQLTGAYTAGDTIESNVEVAVQDANGATAYAYINVIAAPTPTPTPVPGSGITLSLTSSATKIIAGDTATITVKNGTPGYTYKLLSGGGSVSYTPVYFKPNNNTATYTASLYAGNATIQATDSIKNTGTITVSVVDLPLTKVTGTYLLTIDQHFGISYSFTNNDTYPRLFAWGMSPNFNAGVNCTTQVADLPCFKEFKLTNFNKADKLQTSYRGLISFSGRGGNITVDYCIPHNDTSKLYVKQANGGTLTIATRRYLTPVRLFDGAEAQSANFQIDGSSGAGLYTTSFLGQYSVKKDCSDFTTNVYVKPL